MLKSAIVGVLLGSAFLLSCESRKPAATAAVKPAPAADSTVVAQLPTPAGPGAADTADAFVRLRPRADSARTPPAVTIGGQTYHLITSATTNPTRRLPVPKYPQDTTEESSVPPDSIALLSSYGYDVDYNVRLVAANGRPRFSTTLHKADFAAAMGPDHVAVSFGSAPEFYAYLPQFNALAFQVPFYLNDTDDGGEALLLLDAATGKVRHIGRQGWAFGAQSNLTLTHEGRTLLTSFEIIPARGRAIALARKNEEAAGSLLLNESTVLVVYEGQEYADADGGLTNREIKGPNAHLLDFSGRELGSFRFHGTGAGMGYSFTRQYLAQTRTHYLFDGTTNTLCLIPRDNPLRHRLVALRQLPRFTSPQRPTEVRFRLNPDLGNQLTLYVDTLTGALRYTLVEAR